MKETGVILKILIKRLGHRKGFLACLITMPILIFAMQALERTEDTVIPAGIYVERENEWNEKLVSLLTESDSGFQFVQYSDREAMLQDIVAERIECGYILQEDLQKQMDSQKWNNAVTVYESAHSMLTPVINEVFFEKLFTLVSSEWFEGYIANYEAYADVDREKLLQDIRREYRTQLENGSTFDVEHYYVETNQMAVYENGSDTGRTARASEERTGPGVFPVRGIAAVMIFLCGLLGLFDGITDRKEGPFPIRGRQKSVYLYNLFLPVLWAALVGLVTLFFTEEWKGAIEIFYMFVYSILVVIWCLLAGLFIRSEKLLAAALPIVILGSLILAPVFIDLSSFFPVFRVLEKVIPVTYYLRML